MRIAVFSALTSLSLLGACATAGAGHGAMNHEEMMRHCQMMRGQGAPAPEASNPGTAHQH